MEACEIGIAYKSTDYNTIHRCTGNNFKNKQLNTHKAHIIALIRLHFFFFASLGDTVKKTSLLYSLFK